MKKTILVTGSNGFIGSAFATYAKDKYFLIGLDRISRHCDRLGCDAEYQIDVKDSDAVEKLFLQYKIDAVIHTAAEKSLIQCEQNPQAAYEVNYAASKRLYDLCLKYHAKLIYLSSDQVFDGRKGNYSETAPVSAINNYGKLKIMVENLLLRDSSVAICRTALVFGEIPPEQTEYFDTIKEQPDLAVQGYIVQQTVNCLSKGLPIHLPDDEFVSPTHVMELSKQLVAVIERDAHGILHCCGKGRISRYEMGLEIASHYKINAGSIVHASGNNPLRPKDVSLDCTHTESCLGFEFMNFRKALQCYM